MTFSVSDLDAGQSWRMRDGEIVVIRPIRPDDEPMMVVFHSALSPEAVYGRYFNSLQFSQRVGHARLLRVCHPQPGLETVLVAQTATPAANPAIVAVGRLSRREGDQDAEFALIVRDSHQRIGLGSELMRRLITAGGQMAIPRIKGDILADNLPMQRLCGKLGMRLSNRITEGVVEAELDLTIPITPRRIP